MCLVASCKQTVTGWPPDACKIACDWRPVAFKWYPSGCQSHANCTSVVASRKQIPIYFIHVACNWQPRGYNLHATGGHSGIICMRLEATLVQFECDWVPIARYFCMRLAASTVQSFLKARCQNNYLNLQIRKPFKSLRTYSTYVLARAYPSTLCIADPIS